MRVLLVGGAGHVGSFVTPYLREQHDLRVLDLVPPRHAKVEHVRGSITNADDVRRALDGVDTFINMVMKSPQGGSSTDQTLTQIVENYEVNTLGLHVLLWTAHTMGIKRGVHTSSMSVHYRERPWFPSEELVPYDTPSVYGLTKGFGEQICQYFARWFDMNPGAADHRATHARAVPGRARRRATRRTAPVLDRRRRPGARLPGCARGHPDRPRPLRADLYRRRRSRRRAQPVKGAPPAAMGAEVAPPSRRAAKSALAG